MRWTLVVLILFIGTGFSLEEESNEVIIAPSSTKKPANLDTNLRKALLKALVELESEEKENLTRNDYVNIITHLDSDGSNVQKATASSLSFFSTNEPINMTVTVKKSTSKPKHSVIVQKSKDIQKKNAFTDTPEQIIASASNSFASTKSENSKTITGGASQNSLITEGKHKKTKFVQTTTIKPTSSTEESEANVESLQFFSAPLVTAFTIHQDEKGLPKSVVPIFNQVSQVVSTTEKLPETSVRNPEELQREVLKQQRQLEARQEIELRNKQLQLEEEIQRLTKLREEQDKIIREQKLIYEQKLLEQQRKLLEEQQRLYRVQSFVPLPQTTTTSRPSSQSNFNDFRSKSRNTGTVFSIQPSVGFVQPETSSLPVNGQILPIKNPVDFRTPYPQTFSQFEVQNSIATESRPIGTSQTFFSRPQSTLIPVQTIHNSIYPSVNTALNAVVPSVNIPQNTFQSLPTTQLLPIFNQSPAFNQNSFVANQNLPFVASQSVPFRNTIAAPSTHGTRSLRQESGTGNFVNNRYNVQENSNNFLRDQRFSSNSFGSQQLLQSPRNNFGFRNPNALNQYQYNTLQYSVDQPFLNQRLNNLLLQTGLGQGKQHENLNIVSKVLSLNHLGSDSQLANTDNDFKRIRASPSWRVV